MLFANNHLYDDLYKLQMFYKKFSEIPMGQFLTVALSGGLSSLRDQCLFIYGLTEEYINSDDLSLELYYITYEKKYNPVNFI